MSRKISIAVAVSVVAAGNCAGCASTSRTREARSGREVFTIANDRAAAVVYGGFGAFESAQPRQSPFQEFLYGPERRSSRRLRTPQGLATDGRTLWVCDQGYPDVFEIDPTSAVFRTATARLHRPASPVAVALDDTGHVLVADATRRSIMVYNSDGSLAQELFSDGEFEPTAVLVEDNVVFIADRGNRRIARFDLKANTWLTPFMPPSGQVALAVPSGLAKAQNGVLLVSDALLGIVHRVDGDRNWFAPLGSRGRGTGQLVRPIGLCCTPGGLIAVADAARQAVIVFNRDGGHVIDIERNDTASPGWTLPTAVACLRERPHLPGLATSEDAESGDWIVVSDMLGGNGLTLIHLRTVAANAPSEDGR